MAKVKVPYDNYLQRLIQFQDYLSHISVDCVIFGFNGKKLKVLLLKYNDSNLYSLPGGFVINDEDLRDAAARVLFERTQLGNIFLDQFHTFGRNNRIEKSAHKLLLKNKNIEIPEDHWILQRFISVAYCSLLDYSKLKINDLDYSSKWFDIDNLPELVFDHQRIFEKGLIHLRENIDTNIVANNLLPKKFTMKELQILYETVLGVEFRRNNFPRKILGLNIVKREIDYNEEYPEKMPYYYSFIKGMESIEF
jgi:8-oxo-dGTP diphosphatase